MSVPVPIRVAGAIEVVNGFGFGVFIPWSIARLSSRGEILRVFGFPAYGEGPFARAGIPTTVPLLAGFLIVNVGLVVAGALTWNGTRAGAIAGLILMAPGAAFWWGFALPFGPVLGIASAVLVLTSRQALR